MAFCASNKTFVHPQNERLCFARGLRYNERITNPASSEFTDIFSDEQLVTKSRIRFTQRQLNVDCTELQNNLETLNLSEMDSLEVVL